MLLAVPDLFMNLSGRSVVSLSHSYRVPVSRIVVVYDDVSLPLGVVRIKDRGSSGGQKGVESILASMGGEAKCVGMVRIRIGIGTQGTAAPQPSEDALPRKKGKASAKTHLVAPSKTPAGTNLAQYVLQRFSAEEQAMLGGAQGIRRRVAQAILQIVTPVPSRRETRIEAAQRDRAASAAAAPAASALSTSSSSSLPPIDMSEPSAAAAPSIPSAPADDPPSCCCLHASDSSAALARRVQLTMTRFNGQRVAMHDEEDDDQ